MASLTEAFSLLGIGNSPSLLAYNVQLPQIYRNLTLSDFEFANDNKDQNTMIINLCATKLKSKHNIHIYNFDMNDSEDVPYNYFKGIMSQCAQLLHIAETNSIPVIVNCAAGVNRSCSVIVAYAISKGLPIDDTIEYIKQEKKKKYRGERWRTLTNPIFISHLQKIQSER